MVELGLMKLEPIHIWCDNEGAVDLIKNGRFSSKTRHIVVKYSFVKERIDLGDITIAYISTKDMLADLLTKCFTADVHELFLWKIGVRKNL